MYIDLKLMIRLGKNSLYPKKYIFLLQKKANALLSLNVIDKKVMHINFSLILILLSKIKLE